LLEFAYTIEIDILYTKDISAYTQLPTSFQITTVCFIKISLEKDNMQAYN